MFARAWIEANGNATQAGLKSFDTESYGSAAVSAHRTLKNTKVQRHIAKLLAEVDVASINETVITAGIGKIALHDPKARNNDKLKALELLARIKAMLTDKQETKITQEVFKTSADMNNLTLEQLHAEYERRVIAASEGRKTSAAQDQASNGNVERLNANPEAR